MAADGDAAKPGRERVLAWIDAVLEHEAAPDGLAAEILAEATTIPEHDEPVVDVYALTASLTAVAQEVKLQSREFRQVADRLKPLDELVARLSAPRAEPAASADTSQLELLMDTVERLDRLVRVTGETRGRVAAAPAPGLFARLTGAAPSEVAAVGLATVAETLQVAADRLRDELARLGAHQRACAGKAFDPGSMNAVDTVVDAAVPDGTVVEVLRGAWDLHGQPVRTARVRVSRRA